MIKSHKPIFRLGVVLLVSVTFTTGLAVLAQSAAAPERGAAQAAPEAPQRPTFEVAAVKLNRSESRNGGIRWLGDRFTVTNMRVKDLIAFAYGLKDFQVSGGPSWIGSGGYDIDAKAGDSLIKLPDRERRAQMRLMLQSLLADRFKLVLRKETRTFPIYRLVVGKNGSKLNVATVQGPFSVGNGLIAGRGITTATLAELLSSKLERNVVDETHLPGRYDISLRWSPDNGAAPSAAPTSAPQADALQPNTAAGSIFTAVQEQLGLKLESAKEPIETLVVVQIERPSEN